MTIATRAQSLYGDARQLKSPREIEYEIFSRLTARLSMALSESTAAQHHIPEGRPRLTPKLAAALDENRRLWMVLSTDLAHPENALPVELRSKLLGLASFVLGETSRVISGRSQDIAAIIDVNTAVMRGLRGSVSPT